MPTSADSPADRARNPFVDQLANPLAEGHRQALDALAAAPAAEAAPILNELLDRGTLEARQAAIEALRLRADDEPPVRGVWERLAAAPEIDARAEALETAGRLNAERAVRLLPLWTADADVVLRRRALNRLQVTGRAEAGEPAKASLADPDASVRLQAAKVLAAILCPSAVPALSRLARDAERSCRAAAMEALERQSLLAALSTAAAIHRDGPREAAAECLVFLKRFDAEETEHAVYRGVEDALKGGPVPDAADFSALLRRIPTGVLDGLAAREEPEWLRMALLEHDAGADPCDPHALRRLTAACNDERPALRERAVQALECHDLVEPGKALGPLLRLNRPDVRRQAVEALVRSGPRVVPVLRRTLSDGDPAVRRATYTALAALLSEEAEAVWRSALGDAHAGNRAHAVERLDALPDGDAVRAALVQAARDADPQVRAPAVRATVSRGLLLPSLAEAYRDTLAESLAPDVRPPPKPALLAALIDAVARLAPTGALGTLVGAARHKNAVVRRTAADAIAARGGKTALEAFALLADTEDPGILKRVVVVLGDAKDARGLIPAIRAQEECGAAAEALRKYVLQVPRSKTVGFLIESLRNRWPSVKRYAARELIGRDSPDLIPHLLEASEDEDIEVQLAAVQALGKFAKRKEVYERLIAILDYGDVAVRQQAVGTLGEYQVKDAVDPLIRMLDNPFLKQRVEESLMRIGDRKGYLAIKRRKIRARLYGKKKGKGAIAPTVRKGKVGLGRTVRKGGPKH